MVDQPTDAEPHDYTTGDACTHPQQVAQFGTWLLTAYSRSSGVSGSRSADWPQIAQTLLHYRMAEPLAPRTMVCATLTHRLPACRRDGRRYHSAAGACCALNQR